MLLRYLKSYICNSVAELRFIMIVLALLALVVTLVVFTLSQRKKARLQNPHDSYHGRYRA